MTTVPPTGAGFRPTLYIVHSEHEDDRTLAESIARQSSEFADAQCLTVSELIRRIPRRVTLGRIIPGMSVAILSPPVVNDHARCEALTRVLASQYTLLQFFRHYCVCRGIRPEVLREYPELSPILDNVMIWATENDVPAVISDLRDYVTRILPELVQGKQSLFFLKAGIASCIAAGCLLIALLVRWFYTLSFGAAAVLALLWWKSSYSPWSGMLVFLCAFSAGYRLNFLQANDLCPFLGRRWKLPGDIRALNALSILLPIGPLSATGLVFAVITGQRSQWGLWLLIGIVGQLLLDWQCRTALKRRSAVSNAAAQALRDLGAIDAPASLCDLTELAARGFSLIFLIYGAAGITAFAVALRIYPAILVADEASTSVLVGILGPAIVGFLLPAIFELVAPGMVSEAGKAKGLTGGPYTDRMRRAVRPGLSRVIIPASPLDKSDVEVFPLGERAQVLHWLTVRRNCFFRFPLRRWRAARDHAFISYVWNDDLERRNSLKVAQACVAAGIDHFLDKKHVTRQEGLWRIPVASSLAACTHFFLVVSPNIGTGKVILREIEMVMQRWTIELVPAIICIVEPDLAESLRVDSTVPLPIRFVLTFCTQITPAEAAQPALVRYIIDFTRRVGKGHDWLALLSPFTIPVQAIRLPGLIKTV